ncbi:hypothetical protein Tsubulata_036894 [Turnera subulata]|uniref:Uncharacterized protein n=1 Tax=Turnera subulata TaxID=218843 RepID=A0A9Q0FXM1_9ROSI|nr:hypothetical protein Tsubulata_036894 [Turnera subulata]
MAPKQTKATAPTHLTEVDLAEILDAAQEEPDRVDCGLLFRQDRVCTVAVVAGLCCSDSVFVKAEAVLVSFLCPALSSSAARLMAQLNLWGGLKCTTMEEGIHTWVMLDGVGKVPVMFRFCLGNGTRNHNIDKLASFGYVCSLHVALWMKLFEHKPFDSRAVMGFGILNGISIGLLNLSLGFNSVGFYQVDFWQLYGLFNYLFPAFVLENNSVKSLKDEKEMESPLVI